MNDALYKQSFEKSECIQLLVDTSDLRIVNCSEGALNAWSVSKEKMLALSFENLFQESSKYLPRGLLGSSSSGFDSGGVYVSLLSSNGAFFTALMHCQVQLSESLKVYSFSEIANHKQREIPSDVLKQLPIDMREASEILSIIFRQSPVGLAINDFETGRFITVNTAFSGPLGYTSEELINLHFSDITPDEYAEVDSLAFQSMAEHGYYESFEKEYIHKDGSRRWVRLFGSIPTEGLGNKIIWSFVEYIDDYKKLLSNLSENEASLRRAQHQTKLGSWELNIQSGQLNWSDEIYKIFELDSEQYQPSYEKFLDVIHPEDRSRVDQAYQESLKSGQPYEVMHRLAFDDGRIKYVRETCDTNYDQQGNPLVSLGTIQDVSESYEIQLENSRLAAIAHYSKDFIGIANLEGRVTFLNDSALEMLGLPSFRAGYNIADLYSETCRHTVRCDLIPALEQKGRWIGELMLKNFKDEESVLTECNAFRVDDPITGEPICFATVSQNITLRRATQIELRRYHENLEHLVAERTSEVEEARKQAELANAAKSQFLSRMSHELRTPLNAIMGFSQLIQQGMDEPVETIQSFNQEVVSASEVLLELVDEVLEISRIESGHIELKRESLGLEPIVNRVVKQLRVLASKRKIEIKTDFDQVCTIMGDAMRLTQVVTNLISNAIKYGPQGEDILVQLRNEEDVCRLSILDKGVGISESEISTIFEPFERLDNSPHAPDGVGIGLAIAKDLVELMGGQIGCNSFTGSGTEFWIEFPVSKPLVSQINDLKVACEQVNGPVKKVLYIEDNRMNIHVLKKFMDRQEGYDLSVASTGKEGLEQAKLIEPDIILLDLNLPDIPGLEVLEQLKSISFKRFPRVLAVSANALESDIQLALSKGVDDYVTKPFFFDDLIKKIEGE